MSKLPVFDVLNRISAGIGNLPEWVDLQEEDRHIRTELQNLMKNLTLSDEVNCEEPSIMRLTRLFGGYFLELSQHSNENTELCFGVIRTLWALLEDDTIDFAMRGRIVETIARGLAHLSDSRLRHRWVNQENTELLAANEILKQIPECKPEVLVRMIHAFYAEKHSYHSSISRGYLHGLGKCVIALRKFQDADDAYMGTISRYLEFKHSHETILGLVLMNIGLPAVKSYRMLCDGSLYHLWSQYNRTLSKCVDPLFFALARRGVQYAWSVGAAAPFSKEQARLTFWVQTILNQMRLPPQTRYRNEHKIQIPPEYTPLIPRPIHSLHQLGVMLAYLLTCVNEVAPHGDGNDIYGLLQGFVNAIHPYTHPSHAGNWNSAIAEFINSFTSTYVRRACRERSVNVSIGTAETGRYCDGVLHRLTADDDRALSELLLPLLEQGVYSKNPAVAAFFEESTKRLCNLLPETVLPKTVQECCNALTNVHSSHQVLSSLRIMGQICPLLIKYQSALLPQVLDATLLGIDASDPLKSATTFTMHVLLISMMPVIEVSEPHVELRDSCFHERVSTLTSLKCAPVG